MIPVLFEQNEINLPNDIRFKSNGLGILKDTISCYVEEERNEEYESEITYPVEGFLYDKIKGNYWIKMKSNDRYNDQIFRIYYISEPINGVITIKLEHVSYTLKDNFIEKVECNGNCQAALNAINSSAAFPTKYNFYSDITMTALFLHERENLWECIKGIDGSIVDTYGNGADIIRDNFNLSVVQNGGQDNNILICYKKNMTGFTCEEDWTGCITRIYPFAIQDDVVYTISEKYVDSEYISRDPTPRIEKVDFSSEFADDEKITEDALRAMAHNYFINNACDIPKLSYKVEFVQLSITEEFKNIIKKENIALLDNVIIRHEIYNIDTKIKILKTKYNTLLEKYENIELNYTKPRMSKSIVQTVKKQKKEIEQTIENTKEELSNDIDEAKEEAAEATNNLKVTFEKRAEGIELSVKNEEEERQASFEVLDGEIASKVDQDNLGTEIEQNYKHILFAIKHGSNTYVIIDEDGLTVEDGKICIKNSNSDKVMYLSHDVLTIEDVALGKDAQEKGSAFYNSLLNMEEIPLDNGYVGNKSLEDYIIELIKENT